MTTVVTLCGQFTRNMVPKVLTELNRIIDEHKDVIIFDKNDAAVTARTCHSDPMVKLSACIAELYGLKLIQYTSDWETSLHFGIRCFQPSPALVKRVTEMTKYFCEQRGIQQEHALRYRPFVGMVPLLAHFKVGYVIMPGQPRLRSIITESSVVRTYHNDPNCQYKVIEV